jgi:CBS domain-containing protein
MTIGSILTGKKPIIGVATHTSVRDIVALLHENRIGAVLVMAGESRSDAAILGIVSERDITAGLHTHGSAILDTPAADIMTAPVLTVSPQATIADGMQVMTNRRIRHLPVVDRGMLIGLVSIGDLVKRRIEDAEREAVLLKDYIATA